MSKSQFAKLVVSVACERDGKYIMVEEAKPEVRGKWNFPSGKVKVGENLLEAARREFLEETGYSCELTDLLSVYHYAWNDNSGYTVRFNFIAEVAGDTQGPVARDVLQAKWLEVGEIDTLQKDDKFRFGGTEKMWQDIKANKKASLELLYSTEKALKSINYE